MPVIAIVGASAQRHKYGNKAVRAYQRAGWIVYPVNLKEKRIEGLPVYRTVLQVPPGQLDRVSVYLPPAIGKQLLPELAQRSVGQVWFNPGAADAELLRHAAELDLPVISGCSIVDIGSSPHDFP